MLIPHVPLANTKARPGGWAQPGRDHRGGLWNFGDEARLHWPKLWTGEFLNWNWKTYPGISIISRWAMRVQNICQVIFICTSNIFQRRLILMIYVLIWYFIITICHRTTKSSTSLGYKTYPEAWCSLMHWRRVALESILIPVTVKKRDFHIGTPKRCTKQIVFLGNWQSGTWVVWSVCIYFSPARPSCSLWSCSSCFWWVASCHFACSSSCFLVGCLVPFWVLQFVLFGGLPRAILGAPVRAFWWVATCHFACSSLCFLVGCLVPFCVLQFVLFGGLPRAILGAPVCAFWWVASCHFACSSSCFLVGCLLPLWVLQFVLCGGLPRAILDAPVRALWWVASCHFACSSSCFLVGCLVPLCVLQFVLFGGLPRAILGAPVCAFWWVASCHFACSSSCFLVGCLVPFCVLQFVLFGGLPRAILRAPICASN